MSLRDLIETYAAADAESARWADVATILNTPTIEQRASTKVGFDAFIAVIGTDTAEQVLKELSFTEIGTSLRRRLELSALDFADAATIEQLDKIGAKLTSDVLRKLKELGVKTISPAELGGLQPVTAEQCSDAWNLGLKEIALDVVRYAVVEAAQEEYRKSGSTPTSIIAAAIAALEAI